MNKNKWKKVLLFAGTFFGQVVGAGFASGQEVKQYLTDFGLISNLAILIVIPAFAFIAYMYMDLGRRLHTDSHGPIVRYLCGNIVGRVFDYVIIFFTFGVCAIMISGGGTTLNEYFGLNPIVGRVIMVIICILAVSLSYEKFLAIGGILSPIIMIFTFGVGISSGVMNIHNLQTANEAIRQSGVTPNFSSIWVALAIYAAYNINPPVLASMGNAENDRSILRTAAITGAVALGISLFAINIAMLCSYSEIYTYEVPLVKLGYNISTGIGVCFAGILLSGVLTTAVSLFFALISRFSEHGTPKFKVWTVVIGILAFAAGLIPFAQLVGMLYPVMGVVMGIIIVCSVIDFIKIRISPKK